MNYRSVQKWTKHGGMRSFLKRAIECDVKVSPVPKQGRILRLSYGKDVFFMKGANAPVMRRMGNLTRNKVATKVVLEDIGVRTPRGIVANSTRDAIRLVRKHKLRYPLILKPTHGSRALGVTWNIRSEKEIVSAFSNFEKAKRTNGFKKDTFLVEEMFVGREYRVLVLNGRVISCVEKVPASVIGDGKSPVKKLISDFNKTRPRGFKIRVDKTVGQTLKENCLSLESVIENDRVLKLRNNLNMSDGGRSIDVTKKIHRTFRDICVRATNISGLSFAGVDVIARDIAKPARNDDYVVLELNPNPYFNMNEKPLAEGKGTDVSFLLLKQLFPAIRPK